MQRSPSQSLPRKLEVRSASDSSSRLDYVRVISTPIIIIKKKKKKHAWVEHFTLTPKRPPLLTLFVLCMWGGVTDVITHAKFHLNRFSSFGSPGPGGRNSPFPIGLENGSYNSVTH